MSSDGEQRRAVFASEVAAAGGIRSPSLLRAFATVPRERLLPPGPWIIEAVDGSYYATEDADISHILHPVGVAIDATRHLNSGNPAVIGRALEAAEVGRGETVFHVGAGLGYFSAIMAEMVGPAGRVIAAEIDPQFARQCRANLHAWPQVEVVGDALSCALPPLDVVFVSAGTAIVPRRWAEALRPGGRMILPLTGSLDGGFLLHLRKHRSASWLAVKPRSFVRYYPCIGTRDPGDVAVVNEAIADTRALAVRWLRLDPHEREAACWLHAEGWCLTTADADENDLPV